MVLKRMTSRVVLLFGAGLLLATVSPGLAPAVPPPPYVVRIKDLDYIKRQYFLIAASPLKLKPGSLRVFKDDGFPSDAANKVLGIARLDPTAMMDSRLNPERNGIFTPLDPGTDYEVVWLWLVDCNGCGLEIPVIHLAAPLGPQDVLAIAYVDQSSGAEVRVGDLGVAADPSLGKPEGVMLIKLIKPPLNNLVLSPFTGFFDPASPFYPALFYEMRNLYDLKTTNIPLERATFKVRASIPGAYVDPDVVNGVPLIQILGLNQQRDPYSQDPLVPDGRVDSQFLNPSTGMMFFPDLHPFAPDTTNPTGRCDTRSGFGGYNCLDNFGRNILRDEPWSLTQSNLAVYYAGNPNPYTDSRYYIEMTIVPPDEPGGTLQQNTPNPFNPGTTIRFELYQSERARVSIFDVKGRLVTQLLDGVLPRGRHEVAWNGNAARGARVASGIYYCRLEIGGQTYSNRMVLSR